MDFKSDFLYGNTYRIKTVGIAFVRLAVHVSNGWKSLVRASSGKETAETKGVLFTAIPVINVRGIWRKVEANLWSDEQKSHQAIVKDKVAKQTKVQ